MRRSSALGLNKTFQTPRWSLSKSERNRVLVRSYIMERNTTWNKEKTRI